MVEDGGHTVPRSTEVLDVLVVGAGPTGLTLAAQLDAFGVRARIIDRLPDRVHESRALAVQARTLEVLQGVGLADTLVERGNTTTRLCFHFPGSAPLEVPLGGAGAADTRFPFVLFVSQAETEAVLGDHLASAGVSVERGVELTHFRKDARGVICTLRHEGGGEEDVCTRYLVGCDGAHSTVRRGAGIPFRGDAYPQRFLLGDVEIDGPLQRDTIHAFMGERTFALFFPLGWPTTWRMIGMEGEGEPLPDAEPAASALSLQELQLVADLATGARLRLRDPAWLTRFRLHHRQAAHYRTGPIFLAGDAAHIHSPAGAQGMNTGIQDAWNLGWKLALVVRGVADELLLDSYEAERWPVGQFVLRITDRAFSLVTSVADASPRMVRLRNLVAPRLVSPIVASRTLRARAFRIVSQLGIRYRRSAAVAEGRPLLRRGPRAGDRVPDAPVLRDGRRTFLQRELAGPCLHLLLCGVPEAWSEGQLAGLRERYGTLLDIHHLTRAPSAGVLVDATGEALTRLGVGDADAAHYLVRPDGYVGFRSGGTDLDAVARYLARWFPGAGVRRRTGEPSKNSTA